MRIIRASETGTYLFCERAWLYQNQGVKSENQQELAGGREFHQNHGHQVWKIKLMKLAAWFLLISAALVLAVALTLQWTG